MKNSFVGGLFSLVFAICCAGLVLGASYALRRNCEGFGCPNAVVLWSAWIGVYLVVGSCGLRLRTGLLPGTRSRTMVSVSLAVLAVLGVALAGYWWLIHDAT